MSSIQNDFVYNSIYKGAIAAGACEKAAKDHAIMGLEDYKKGKFHKAIELITTRIANAKKDSKNEPTKPHKQRVNQSPALFG